MTDQKPLGSGFGARSTAADVLAGIDLHGRLRDRHRWRVRARHEAVKALVAAGAEVLVPARNPDAAAKAFAGMDGVSVARLDLGDLESVAAFADDVLAAERPIDMLIACAGIMACPETRVGPGWEAQFATNHLGHFALVNRLAPLLIDGGARVVLVSSAAHMRSAIRWDDIHFNTDYENGRPMGSPRPPTR